MQITGFITAGSEALTLCRCCKDFYHAEDFAPELFRDPATIEAQWGGPVCMACMDDMHLTCDSNRYLPRSHVVLDDDGDAWESCGEMIAHQAYGRHALATGEW
jgi:hypothetical protein